MGYTVEFDEDGEKDLKRLPTATAQRVLKKLNWLGEHADEVQHELLVGSLAGFYKWRVGKYRIVYSLLDNPGRIVVHIVDHRDVVYD